jgi:hypothetical protein
MKVDAKEMLADLRAAKRRAIAARVGVVFTWALLLGGFVACEYIEAGREGACEQRDGCVWIDGCSHNRCVCK